jgi:hypothetical protein
MNPLNPKKLLLTKWTAVKSIAKQKHFLVSRVIQPDLPTDPIVNRGHARNACNRSSDIGRRLS